MELFEFMESDKADIVESIIDCIEESVCSHCKRVKSDTFKHEQAKVAERKNLIERMSEAHKANMAKLEEALKRPPLKAPFFRRVKYLLTGL